MPSHTPTSTIAAYAAGASLAAVTLVYVFSPSLFLDDSANTSPASSSRRKSGVVGLSNPANDCFINSVLQALAGLGELRIYLIRELHRRQLLLDEDKEAFDIVEAEGKAGGVERRKWKQRVLQGSIVTAALKNVLDRLNERPLYSKTISNGEFVRELEKAFGTKISRQQQDAQEFLQLVAERVDEEWGALVKVKKRVWRRRKGRDRKTLEENEEALVDEDGAAQSSELDVSTTNEDKKDSVGTEEPALNHDTEEDETDSSTPNPFPFSGMLESYVECQTCHFVPKPSQTAFVTLTLHVPQGNSTTTLDDCIDGLLKIEHIDDYKCDRCRLQHALDTAQSTFTRSTDDSQKANLSTTVTRLQTALATDPSTPPTDITLPPSDQAPNRRIEKHVRIVSHPRILAIHLSRSIFAGTSSKNTSKVTFPELLTLGGLTDRRQYRLLALITHQGGHNRGHYETFRRQIVLPSWPSSSSSSSSHQPPAAEPQQQQQSTSNGNEKRGSTASNNADAPLNRITSTATADSPRSSLSTTKTRTTSTSTSAATATTTTNTTTTTASTTAPTTTNAAATAAGRKSSSSSSMYSYASAIPPLRRKRAKNMDRWWRISDERVRECDTVDVLGMRGEVYLLFYEMVG